MWARVSLFTDTIVYGTGSVKIWKTRHKIAYLRICGFFTLHEDRGILGFRALEYRLSISSQGCVLVSERELAISANNVVCWRLSKFKTLAHERLPVSRLKPTRAVMKQEADKILRSPSKPSTFSDVYHHLI